MQKLYYIYHIPGVKIGCTSNLLRRMREQGFTHWEVLETHTDSQLASKREKELQIQYGYKIDTISYNIDHYAEMGKKGGKIGCKIKKSIGGKIGASKGGKTTGMKRRKLTQSDAEKIRRVYIPRDKQFGCKALAEQYGVAPNAIRQIIHGKTYTS